MTLADRNPDAPFPKPAVFVASAARTIRVALTAVTVFAAALPLYAQRAAGRPQPSAAAQKCGSAVAWQSRLDVALELARKSGKPVFWYVPTTPNSPMDRKDVVDFYMRAGMFSMPDVTSLLASRAVALKLEAPAKRRRRTDDDGAQDQTDVFKKYGIKVGDFVEPGFVLLKPDGAAFFKLDRLSTFHEGFLTALLDREFKKAGFDLPETPGAAPSDAAAAALAAGDPARALSLLSAPTDAANAPAAETRRVRLLRGRALVRLGRGAEASAELKALGDDPDARFELGRLALATEDESAAVEHFTSAKKGVHAAAAALYLGAAEWRLGRRKEAMATWKSLAASSPDSALAWKAAAEVDGFGPFARGFEEFGLLREDALLPSLEGTQRPRVEADAAWLVRRGVDYLLKNQGPDGGFEDSNYDFGGRESLPDVYVAVTAIAGRALLAWRDVDPARIDAAVLKALAYCDDESRCMSKNTQERMWAHGYRTFFLRDALKAGVGDPAKLRKKLQEIVGHMQELQTKKGAWFHEYPNPFVTALAVHALHDAKQAGARIDPAKFDAGAQALLSTRDKKGDFSYGFPGKGDANPTFAAGRNPQAEFALKLAGHSDDAKVADALERALKHHDAYESTRKYDNHAPPHGIGGFFFFYDEMHRADAARSLADPTVRRSFLDRQRALLFKIPEIDGCFVDSHELGKPYGAAAGLLVLKATQTDGP